MVHVDLENRTAKHIMIKLYFQHEWILISEVTFKTSKFLLLIGSPHTNSQLKNIVLNIIIVPNTKTLGLTWTTNLVVPIYWD